MSIVRNDAACAALAAAPARSASPPAAAPPRTSAEQRAAAAPPRPPSAAADPNATIKEGLKIAFLPKQINNPYFTISDKGGEDAVKELKGEFKEVGPSDATASSQVSYINTLTQQQQDAIVDLRQRPERGRARAQAGHGATASRSSPTTPTPPPRAATCSSTRPPPRTSAAAEVQLLAEQIGQQSGEIAILSATPNATNQNTWIEFMKDELAKPEYSRTSSSSRSPTATTTTRSPSRRPRACCRRTRT